MTQLPLFESNEIARARVRITKAGDGLSEALKVSPRAMQYGEEVSILLRCVVKGVNFKGDKNGELERIHTLETIDGTEIDQDNADKLLRLAAEDLERRRADAAGQEPLPDYEHSPDEGDPHDPAPEPDL
jgi:hypothetical protein